MTPAAMREFVHGEIDRWATVVRADKYPAGVIFQLAVIGLVGGNWLQL